MPMNLTNTVSKVPAAEEFLSRMRQTIEISRRNIRLAQQAQKRQADKHRRNHQFKIGDLVLLSDQNLISTERKSRKLKLRFEEPFKITDQIGENSFKLNLDGKLHVHPVFRASLLRPYHENDDAQFPGTVQPPPPPIKIQGEQEFEVERCSRSQDKTQSKTVSDLVERILRTRRHPGNQQKIYQTPKTPSRIIYQTRVFIKSPGRHPPLPRRQT